ncbi:MAG: hypothetical protein CMJ58_04340 [Planctomycetaceae bacterium]|nr:hypothetical protein [Planctomycetaceae bacterium]
MRKFLDGLVVAMCLAGALGMLGATAGCSSEEKVQMPENPTPLPGPDARLKRQGADQAPEQQSPQS